MYGALTHARHRGAIRWVRKLAPALVIASLALLGVAAGARSQPRPFNGSVWVGIKG
jgi:hypothetical protein